MDSDGRASLALGRDIVLSFELRQGPAAKNPCGFAAAKRGVVCHIEPGLAA